MAILNVANYSTGSNGLYNYINICNNVNDYAGQGYECLASSTYMMRISTVSLTIDGVSKSYVALFNNQNVSNPATWTETKLNRFNTTFGYNLTIPSGLLNAIPLFPYEEGSAPYNNSTYLPAIPDFDNPVWVSYNNWSSYNASIVYKPIIIKTPVASDDGGDTPASDYSQISNAIYNLGAVIIVVCFFSMIYKIFHRLRG